MQRVMTKINEEVKKLRSISNSTRITRVKRRRKWWKKRRIGLIKIGACLEEKKFVSSQSSIECKLNQMQNKMSSSSGGKLITSKGINLKAATCRKASNNQRLTWMKTKQWTWLLAATLQILLLKLTIIEALKVSVSIPELVKLNDAFWLNCSHHSKLSSLGLQQQQQQDQTATTTNDQPFPTGDMQEQRNDKDEIYAIKWYKDDEEFYRFLPNAQPKVSIYETNGIQLDQSKSYEGNVFVSKADVNTEGNYRCEILSEAPLFETVRKSKLLRVYALPVRGPRIEILDSNGKPKSPKAQEISYAVGDKIELRCNSAPSKPAARLRWYLNEHELTIPNSTTNSTQHTTTTTTTGGDRQHRSVDTNLNQATQLLGYDVRVTPIEYRQHYKSIYSSHSTLSLILQQDDLVNNKISFKCLASMRQDVPLRSKQLITLMPTILSNQASLIEPSKSRILRAKRFLSEDLITAPGSSDSEAHVYHRQRPQHHRHSITRLPISSSSSLSSTLASTRSLSRTLSTDLIKNLQEDSENLMAYIYEDSDSTLGSSITDTIENLENYLRKNSNNYSDIASNQPLNNNYGLEFNNGDNLEYIQLLRERIARQRSFPASHQATNGGSPHSLKRLHGPNSLIKSPFYPDEHDSLRPIISWPPLDSGKLMLLPPGNTIVAIPTLASGVRGSQSKNEQTFILPSRANLDPPDSQSFKFKNSLIDSNDVRAKQVILEKLLSNLNCTCTDGSIDTKLGWIVNDIALETRDTRFYPTRISPDHRQTWLTIGLQMSNYQQPGFNMFDSPARFQTSAPSISSLQSILNQYVKGVHTSTTKNNPSADVGHRFDSKPPSSNQQLATNNQLRFICQAIHSMLLYSSSEMITFDFNPPPLTPVEGNSIDKLSSLPSNVIQATSASQSSSAQGRYNTIILLGSQTIYYFVLVTSIVSMYIKPAYF